MNERKVAGTVAGAAGLIAVTTLLARAVGFGRVVVFADAVRAGGVGEIYSAVNAVPNVLFEVAAGGVLAAVAVPLIGTHLGRGDRPRADRLASVLLTWTLLILAPLAFVLFLAADPITHLLVEGRDPASHAVGATMLRIFAVQVPLYGLGIILTGLLQAHRRFLAAALAPLLSSIVVLGSYLVYGHLVSGVTSPSQVPDSAIQVLAWGTTAGVAILSLPLLLPAWRAGWRWSPGLTMDDSDRRRILGLAGGGLLALLAQQVSVIVILWLTGHAGEPGVLPVQQYVQAVYLLPYAVLAVPIATSVVPALAHGEGRGSDEAALVGRSLRGILTLSGLAAGVLMAVSPAVGAFFAALDARRGAAGASPAALDALPVGLFTAAPGLVGFGAAALLTRVLYVRGQPLAAGACVAGGWILAAVLPLLMVGRGASAGATLQAVGVASSLGMSLTAIALAVLVRHHWGTEALAGAGRTTGVVVVALAAAVIAGDVVTRGREIVGVGPALFHGLLGGLFALMAGLFVVLLGDRQAIKQAVQRGRQRRGRS